MFFFTYKSIVYYSRLKVEGTVIRLDKRNYKVTTGGSNTFSNSRKSYSFEKVQAPVISYKYKNFDNVISNPYWGKANELKVNDKVFLLIEEESNEIHLVTFTHFWFTSYDIIVVFSLIFIVTIIFSINFKEKKEEKTTRPHPLFKDERI